MKKDRKDKGGEGRSKTRMKGEREMKREFKDETRRRKKGCKKGDEYDRNRMVKKRNNDNGEKHGGRKEQ